MTLAEAIAILKSAGIENPAYDARIIFNKLGKIPMSRLVTGEGEGDCSVDAAIEKRAGRYPLEYIIGSVDFYKESYAVNEGCLIPRDDTEALVDFAVKNLKRGAHFLDLCTGSGCVCLSVLNNTEQTTADAVDISDDALKLAATNAEALGLSERVAFHRLDVLTQKLDGEFDVILSNPPYVKECDYDALSPEIKKEPRIAFVGGADGLDFYRKIVDDYRGALKMGGFFAFEIGYDEAADLVAIAREHGMEAEIIRDLSGNDRVAVLRIIQLAKSKHSVDTER